MPSIEYLTGFEGTHIFGFGRDVLETTEHTTRYPEDLLQLQQDGMSTFRACIPWHRIEQHRGAYDWRWTDHYLTFARMLGLDPIVDPLHHTSFPAWLEGGFADPEFEPCYLAFLDAFAQRYPWIKRYTVINEPFVTAWLCGYCEIWQPRHRGHAGFVPMLRPYRLQYRRKLTNVRRAQTSHTTAVVLGRRTTVRFARTSQGAERPRLQYAA